jgi:hypothetical protein
LSSCFTGHLFLPHWSSVEDIHIALDSINRPNQPQEPSHTDSILLGIEAINNTLQHFSTRLEALETKQTKPKSSLKPAKEKKLKSESEPQSPAAPPPQVVKGSATLDEIPQQPEITSTLAKRWKMTSKSLTRQRQRYEDRPDGFFTYSLEKEEGRFGWVYDAQNQFFYAALESPTSSTPGASTQPQQPLLSLNSGQLAKRLKMGSSTIRNFKRTRSPQEFADYCCQHDPDGFTWRFNEETKQYETFS